MSLQTFNLNCLACHILAKHPKFATRKSTLVKIQTTPSSIKQPKIHKQAVRAVAPVEHQAIVKIA